MDQGFLIFLKMQFLDQCFPMFRFLCSIKYNFWNKASYVKVSIFLKIQFLDKGFLKFKILCSLKYNFWIKSFLCLGFMLLKIQHNNIHNSAMYFVFHYLWYISYFVQRTINMYNKRITRFLIEVVINI